MISQVFILHRRPDMSREEFSAYWKDVHGPIATKVPGVQRYVQHHARPDANGEPAVDGVAEFVVADASSFSTPEWEAVMSDIPNFIDESRLVAVSVDSATIV
jgi:uncharacterized protein (TIGR02118 family)